MLLSANNASLWARQDGFCSAQGGGHHLWARNDATKCASTPHCEDLTGMNHGSVLAAMSATHRQRCNAVPGGSGSGGAGVGKGSYSPLADRIWLLRFHTARECGSFAANRSWCYKNCTWFACWAGISRGGGSQRRSADPPASWPAPQLDRQPGSVPTSPPHSQPAARGAMADGAPLLDRDTLFRR